MSGIVTICNHKKDLEELNTKFKDMTKLLSHGKYEGYSVSPHCLMGYCEQETNNHKPFVYNYCDTIYKISYYGEIYNLKSIKNQLILLGYTFQTVQDDEIVLLSYIEYQENCLDLFEGAFVIIIDDEKKLFVVRDQLGIKPLYYHLDDDTLVIASEIKCILSYIGKAIVDEHGVKELLGLGPSLTPGYTIYQNIFSLRPGYYMYFDKGIDINCYWKLHDEKHTDNLEETIHKVRELVVESIQNQLDGHVSSMLSGGLDSSIVTAVASQYIQPLSTYSITYEDQDKYFEAYEYQTTMDDDYIHEMAERYKSHHHKITLTQSDLIEALEAALYARDMPGMADVDSSLFLFSKHISKEHQIALSGECADEIFGGYPWFYKEELSQLPHFPWMRDLDLKLDLFNDKVKALNLKDYIIQKYQESLLEIDTDDRKKQLIYLNTQWFMQTLLVRADSQMTRASLKARVPFASTKIVQYLYNMPWEYMYLNHEEKGILRKAFEDFLPEDIAHRKKNPFPKTHSPIYRDLIYTKLKESLDDSSNILYDFFDREKLIHFIDSKGENFTTPWFGQLMMGPQLMAYFYQIYLWGKLYNVELQF